MNRAQVFSSISEFFRRLGRWIARHPWITASIIPVLGLAAGVAFVAAIVPLTPSTDDIRRTQTERPTTVLTADGKELAVFKRANRQRVKLADMSPNLLAALIATEDRRFYDHHGFDFTRTLSAAFHTATGDLQGGSTITQQLARNLFPDEIGRAPTITRKVKEAITAFKIESIYTKDEILESYLNTVPFLYNAYGIEMAARTYFQKSAGELDVLESATLIGMLKGTSYYNPVLNPARAKERRNIVLAQLVKSGKLDAASFEALRQKPLRIEFERQEEPSGPAPHVTQQVRRWLIEWADRNGYNIYGDGLVVHTTIDSRLQEFANDAVTRQADKLQKIADSTWGKAAGWAKHRDIARPFIRESDAYRVAVAAGLSDAEAIKKIEADHDAMDAMWTEKTHLESGFMALEPSTGQIKAWVGSRDFDNEKFDHVQQARRQPGSTFKPFVYGAAFEMGVNPLETLIDQPMEFRIDATTVWKPTDVDPPSGLPMTLRDGLIHSKNTITSQLVQRVGAARVAKVAYDMGVRYSKLEAVPSLALGTSPVTLREMVSAFGSIANGGNYIEPVLITHIEDMHHRTIATFATKAPEHAMDNAAAQTLLDVMRGVIDQGTGAGIRQRFGIQADVAGKTGTTQDNTDGWFILMHPQLVAGAWVGFNDNRVTMRGDWGQGAHNALNVVGDFFQQSFKAKALDAKMKFAAPRQPDTGPVNNMNDWFNNLFQNAPQPGQQPLPDQQSPDQRLPEVAQSQPLPVSQSMPSAPNQPNSQSTGMLIVVPPSQDSIVERPALSAAEPARQGSFEMVPRRARVIRPGEGGERVVIAPGMEASAAGPSPSVGSSGSTMGGPPSAVEGMRPMVPRGAQRLELPGTMSDSE